MVEASKQPAVMVDESGLEVISKMPETHKRAMVDLLALLKTHKSTKTFAVDIEIPDGAPERVKNELVEHRGKTFRIGIQIPNGDIAVYWYEANDRSMVFVYEVAWPAELIGV